MYIEMTSSFVQPLRHIFDASDVEAFKSSPAFQDLLKFIAAVNHAVADKSLDFACTQNAALTQIIAFLGEMQGWIDTIPPIQQPMRYGNKAFRQWHDKLILEAPRMCKSLLTEETYGAEIELCPYLHDAFGNATRIDYGTGHETTFMIFMYCLARLRLIGPDDLPAVGLRVFPAYLTVCRKLQRNYWLEPAGSHGVWSLDDYQFLVFLFGSSQLQSHKHIRPRSVLSSEILEGFTKQYMYLGAIQFIIDVKSGAPFQEHSPMLYDLSGLPSWSKVNEELSKLYKVEVLSKLPVVQHLVFGSLFAQSWIASRTPVPSEVMLHAVALNSSDIRSAATAEALAARVGAETVPIDEPDRAVAPWITSPQMPDVNITGKAPWAQ